MSTYNEYENADETVDLPLEDIEPAEPEWDVVEPEPEVVVEEVVVEAPKAHKASKAGVPPTTYAVTGDGETDEVHLSKCIYKNKTQRRVLSVYHVQRRLAEWGFGSASQEKPGWYGDLTVSSVRKFQEHVGLPASGIVDAETLTALFEGDTNVTVVL